MGESAFVPEGQADEVARHEMCLGSDAERPPSRSGTVDSHCQSRMARR